MPKGSFRFQYISAGVLHIILVKLQSRTAPQAVSTREEPTTDGTIYCWLSTSAPTARPGYVMPGGGKKAVFPTMALHDHEKNRVTANEQDRIKKFHQSRGRKYALHLVHSKRLPSSGQHDIQFHQSRAVKSSVEASGSRVVTSNIPPSFLPALRLMGLCHLTTCITRQAILLVEWWEWLTTLY
uniref:(California timema) hypothetical protein n=1 Tax=Timema californicum TaxID=61474 RepID=A0A7R9P3V5_TIMCA|nr:unnamed protein product [Timema californicum]